MTRFRTAVAATLLLATVPGTATADEAGAMAGWGHQRLDRGVDLYSTKVGDPAADRWTVTVRESGAQLLPAVDAATLADRLRAAGHEPRVDEIVWPAGADRGGPMGSRVRVGSHPDKAAADELRTSLAANGFDVVTEWTGADAEAGTGSTDVRVAVIDPHRFHGSLDATFGTGVAGRERLTEMSAGSVLAVNAGFFVMEDVDGVPGAAAGIAAYQGKPQSAATNGRIAAILRGDGARPEFAHLRGKSTVRIGGAREIVDGVNRTPGVIRNCGGVGGDLPTEEPRHDMTCTDPDEIVEFTAELGAHTPAGPGLETVLDEHGTVVRQRPRGGAVPQGGSVLAGIGAGENWLREHAQAGTAPRVEHRITDEHGAPVRLRPGDDIVNGGPELVRGGAVSVDFGADGIDHPGDPSFAYTWGVKRNPRTVIGVDGAGRLLVLTADGRQPGRSDGLGLAEAAELMRSIGAVRAMNLDGGGSTAMTVGGALIGSPSDASGERAIGDALILRR